jgi:hypothetical protein
MMIPYPEGFNLQHYLDSGQFPSDLTVGVNWEEDGAALDAGYTQADEDAIVASFAAYDPNKPTFEEIETGRTSQARARWLASQLAGKTPEEAYTLIENALTNATTVAQMRQVLTQLLPVIGGGLVYLARNLEE